MDAKRKRKTDCRRRCCECGRKYVPKPSAQKHQKACCEECRQKRRAGQARDRYAAHLPKSRADAARRQRESRERRKAGPEPPKVSLPARVTRVIAQVMAGLPSEGSVGREQVEDALRRVALEACGSTMSRASLCGDFSMRSTG